MVKEIKIFSRLCKEINVFLSKDFKRIVDYFNKENSYVFYGRAPIRFSTGDLTREVKFYKLQIDFMRRLIDEDLLTGKDYTILFEDFLRRYDLSAHSSFSNEWPIIVEKGGKVNFTYLVLAKCKEKFIEIPGDIEESIISGLMCAHT